LVAAAYVDERNLMMNLLENSLISVDSFVNDDYDTCIVVVVVVDDMNVESNCCIVSN
jgi:hypothetical protein